MNNLETAGEARFIKLVPHLPVKNLEQTLAYYRDVLSFTNEWTFGNGDGGISREISKKYHKGTKLFHIGRVH